MMKMILNVIEFVLALVGVVGGFTITTLASGCAIYVLGCVIASWSQWAVLGFAAAAVAGFFGTGVMVVWAEETLTTMRKKTKAEAQ